LPLIQGARNPKIAADGRGFMELGAKLKPIEIPTGEVSRAQGDVHPGGNPHFQLDPERMGDAAVLVAGRLSELDSAGAAEYQKNAADFKSKMLSLSKDLKARLLKTGVREIVTYHKTLSYFMDRFGIANPLQLEPKPGIPPTASHLLDVTRQMKSRGVKLILVENFYDMDAAEKIKQSLPGVKIAAVPVSVGGEPAIQTNQQLFERIVQIIEDASK
jgi:zinc/manganese transport system substrate-binding protein